LLPLVQPSQPKWIRTFFGQQYSPAKYLNKLVRY
jgi:hypothetical protein